MLACDMDIYMKYEDCNHIAFVVSEMYERRELLNTRYMLKELRACYTKLHCRAIEGILKEAKRLKWHSIHKPNKGVFGPIRARAYLSEKSGSINSSIMHFIKRWG